MPCLYAIEKTIQILSSHLSSMSRSLLFVSLLMAHFCYAQSPADQGVSAIDKTIDSLSFAKSPQQKINLSQRIAIRLADEDWSRAISYLELAEREAGKLKNDKVRLAEIYMVAANMYSSKDVLDVTLDYYQKAYAIYHTANDTAEVIKIENNVAIIYARLMTICNKKETHCA